MSESNNNIPMRITQLPEATAYEDGTYYAVAKAGYGTNKIDVDKPTKNDILADQKISLANKYVTNFFDGNYEHFAILANYVFQTDVLGRTAIIPCKPNTQYFIKKMSSNRIRVGCSATRYPIGETITEMTMTIIGDTENYSFTTPSNANYILIYVSSQEEEPNMFVGNVEAFQILQNNSSVLADNSIFHESNKIYQFSNLLNSQYAYNLFDGNYVEDYGLIVRQDSSLTFFNVIDETTAIVPIKPNTKYYIRYFDAPNRFRLGTCNKFPEVGDPVTFIDNLNNPGKKAANFTSGNDAKYMILTVSSIREKPRLQIIEGQDSLVFIGYDSLVKKDNIETDVPYYFLDDISGVFDANQVPSALNENTTRISDIYSIYDTLMETHSSYISKTVLGEVSSENLEMRKYVFDSLKITNNSTYSLKKPKLILNAGIHGYEQGSAYSLANALKQITEGTDEISKFIRNNITLVVVPVANPYGYNHNQRKNENAVDLNRNFSAGWTKIGTPADEYYSGESANSEEETQILSTLLSDNSDAFAAIDFHNIATGYPLLYINNNYQVQFCNSLFVTLTQKWLGEYSGFPTNQLLGYANSGSPATFAAQALSLDIFSFTAESPWVMPVIGSSKYDIPSLTAGVDVFGNVLAMLAKSLLK